MAQPTTAATEATPQNKDEPAALRLPPEIVTAICNQVDNRTIKSLRATCRLYSRTASLRLSRVFISANPRNIEVFSAIARHETLRHQVTEIIWDDATLYEGPRSGRGEEFEAYSEDDAFVDDSNEESDFGDDSGEDDGSNRTGEELKWYRGENEFGIDWRGKHVPKWYRKACKTNIFDLMSAKGDDIDKTEHLFSAEQQLASHMPVRGAWAYYQELLKQQREVLNSKAHIKAFEDHIGSFPSLRRITITPATYGRLFSPLYETPIIRAFPLGFNFPIPRGWPVVDRYQQDCPEWDNGSGWQGFRIVTNALAQDKDGRRVTELRVDACQLQTGLNSLVFESENVTFRQFKKILARPNFVHLHLDLMVDPYERQARVFRAGLLKSALAGAAAGKGLKHLSIGTNIETIGAYRRDDFYVPLETIFDPTALSRIQYFSLSRFYVKDFDLLILLASLPHTLRTVELNLVEFMDGHGTFRSFLNQVRDELGWQDRALKPSMRLSVETELIERLRQIWVEDELDSFLYKGQPNPFGKETDVAPQYLKPGFGRIKDAFMPEWAQPYV